MTNDNVSAESARSELDTSVPRSARVWNYWLGGKDNYPSDRPVGEAIRETNPHIVEIAVSAHVFLVRAVAHLIRDVGVRQFLDVGTGLPTANNTHEVAQSIAPESRVVYSDHDPLVLAHARVLLVGTQPIALMLMGILGHITDDDEAHSLVRQLVAALLSGSYPHELACTSCSRWRSSPHRDTPGSGTNWWPEYSPRMSCFGEQACAGPRWSGLSGRRGPRPGCGCAGSPQEPWPVQARAAA